jgi:adenylate cyclase
MKRCPECRRDYYDETLLYCLDDGNALLEGPGLSSERPTLVSSASDVTAKLWTDESRKISNSIAVLPFVNMSGDTDNEYFCDGLAEELLNALAKIDGLKVAARTSAFSFKGKAVDIGEIGQKLSVKCVLEGSVRKSGDKLRITVQLINAADGYHLWSERYDRGMQDIFDVQDEITIAVVESLKLKLFSGQKAAVLKHYTSNPDAYQLYLKGRYYLNKWTKDGLEKAIDYFDQTIEMESRFAPAYSGLADCYGSLSCEMLSISPKDAFPKAKLAALKALEIDETLAEAHTSMALLSLNFDWDWMRAEKGLKRALELNPNYVAAYHWYSHYLIAAGRMEESLTISMRALELDPLDLEINAHLGWHYNHTHECDKAIEQCKKTIEMDPHFHEAHWFLGWAYEQKSMYREAIAEFQKGVDCSGGSARMQAQLGHAYALAGETDKALKIADDLMELSAKQYISPYNMAVVYAGLGDNDKGFTWLNKSFEDRSGMLIYLRTQHTFDPISDDPRFAECIARLGLPDPLKA